MKLRLIRKFYKTFSVVIPVYGEKLNLILLHKRLISVLDSLKNDYEIIMVDDNSPDNSWEIISSLSKNDAKIKGIKLSKNFGRDRYSNRACIMLKVNGALSWIVICKIGQKR